MRRAGKIILCVIVLLIAAVLWARWSAPPWPERLPHVQLEPTRPILRPDQVSPDNAFYYIREMTNFAGLPRMGDATNEYERFKALGWSKGSYTQLEAIVAADTEAFAMYRKAADMERCQLVTMNSFTCLVPYVSVVLEKSRALCFEAEWAAGRGDWRTAARDFRAVLRIGDHLTRGGAVIDCLVGCAGKAMACYSLGRVAAQGNPPKRFFRDRIQELLDSDQNTEPFAEMIRYERLAGQDAIRMFSEGDVWELLSLSGGSQEKARLMKRLARAGLLKNTPAHFDAVYSHIIAHASAPYAADDSFMRVVPPIQVRNPVKQFGVLMDDPIGRILINLIIPALDQCRERYVGTQAIVRGMALFLAVRAYQADHRGTLPDKLAALVPDYLDALPEDPFAKNQAPFLYAVSGEAWTIYSVGPNQQDDQGQYDWGNKEEKSRYRDRLDICFSPERFERDRDAFLEGKAAAHADTHQSSDSH